MEIRSGLAMGLLVGLAGVAFGQEAGTEATRLTIYNDDFAVARTMIPLNLHVGVNEVVTSSVTSQLEPDSVVLRDPASRNPVQVLEQNYDAGVVNQAWLLQKYEGQTIDFQTSGTQVIETTTGERKTLPATVVQGRIIRAGSEPLIEVNGKMQFQLPGLPLFPVKTDGLLLKPSLRWRIDAKQAASFAAELDYITHGMKWFATYNVLVPETEDTTAAEKADVMGWVTIENHSGTEFGEATIQLMAGDVAKLKQTRQYDRVPSSMNIAAAVSVAPEVTQKAFDEFHLYDLHRTVSLRNGEKKQVQFLEAAGVTVQRTYQYEGTGAVRMYAGFRNEQPNIGDAGNTQVAVLEEIQNTKANHLGIPLPGGRLRLYRRDSDGQTQFVGESLIPHTPAEKPVEVVTGKAFDLTATRKQTDFHEEKGFKTMDESFEVRLTNQKAQAVKVHVVEHMNRGENWAIRAKSGEFEKKDSGTVDFPVNVPAKGEAVLTYTVRYSW